MRARGLLIAYVVTFLAACGSLSGDDAGEQTAATPLATLAATTTTTEVRPALSYEAQLLDGGTVTIEEGVGELSEFTQGKPTAIYELDLLAAIPDCEGLGLSIWDWTTKAGPSDTGMKASAYAKHGDNLYKFIGCGTSAEANPDDTTELDPRFDTCKEANDAGFVDYRRGIDPEYEWYDDADNDGVACEGGFGD